MAQTQQNISDQIFFDAISGIDPLKMQGKSYQEVISYGLEAYRTIKGCCWASLYLVNQHNFDFQFKTSTDGIDKKIAEDTFNLLIENGNIPGSLSTGEITFGKLGNDRYKDNFLIIPLIVQSGIIGLVILSLDKSFPNQDETIKLCRVYSNYYTLVMQNYFLIEEIQDIKLSSDKQISARTNKIVKSTRELKSILDAVHAGIIIIDRENMQIADANLTAVQLTGISKEDIIGTEIGNLFTSIDGTTKLNKFTPNIEEILKRNDGTSIPVIKTIAGINLGEDEFNIETFLDITDRKRMELALQEAHDKLEQRVEERTHQLSVANKELQKEITERIKIENELVAAKERAEQSDKLKSVILANMQHELRTPLISIRGFSQILMEEITNPEQLDMLNDIYSSGQRLLNTLNSVLFMSKFESDIISMELKTFNLSQLIIGIIPPFKIAAIEKNLEFILNLDDELILKIDADMFSQAIINLLDNAVKFTKAGHISVSIGKDRADGQEWGLIKISDTGIGINDSEQEVIFKAFRQGSEGYTRKYEGNGLGLTLSKKMIELMNGKITLESKLNAGSTFTVWLPIN
jgi:PAS domain S-box-containing protein